ncbi:hypothetical protein J8281_10750 [Aquimarina sp. U1-2]|uniref:hypothetical protein n=1 Tax=Aquimarina sp. U1-2 TaxID=2823141 RepID=UPI001AECDE71|nr:hypothetical protein [Aquimarina sp. U1-2]MBP2832664.1 hypothetical protein [Aquimarina sp. U1-2]
MMLLPKNKFIQPNYTFNLPKSKQGSIEFSVRGNNNAFNVNDTGQVKNNAYKDAGFYTGAFCPITGLFY